MFISRCQPTTDALPDQIRIVSHGRKRSDLTGAIQYPTHYELGYSKDTKLCPTSSATQTQTQTFPTTKAMTP